MSVNEQVEEIMAVIIKQIDVARENIAQKDFKGAQEYLALANSNCEHLLVLCPKNP